MVKVTSHMDSRSTKFRVEVSPNIHRAIVFLVDYLNLPERILVDMAIREFSSKRLPVGWENQDPEVCLDDGS
jgi:hypothetical protein